MDLDRQSLVYSCAACNACHNCSRVLRINSTTFCLALSKFVPCNQVDPDLNCIFQFTDKPGHNYALKSGILVRVWRDKLSPTEATIHQIVVTESMCGKLLHIAAGHLGVAKTKDCLLHYLYWPSISRDTKEYCQSCDICRLGKRASYA